MQEDTLVYDIAKNNGYVIQHGHIMHFSSQLRFWETVREGKWWGMKAFNVIDNYLKNDKEFVDIGAWNGVLSMYASTLCKKVYSAEPDPAAFEILKSNIELNQENNLCKNVIISPFAIGNATRTEKLFSSGFLGDSMSSLNDRKDNLMSVDVFCATLEDFLKNQGTEIKNIGLIKIDAEGGEVKVLQGSKDFITQHLPTIYVSFHPYWYEEYESDMITLRDIVFLYPKVMDAKGNQISRRIFMDLNDSQKGFELILSK